MTFGLCLLILLMTWLSYWPVTKAGYIWDDDNYVTQNATLRQPAGLLEIWGNPLSTPQYYPLVHTSYWIEYQLWGLDPAGYHLTNVMLHGLNACLVFLIVRQLAIPGAIWPALIFALHPVHVESVAWITERKNVLSGFFYLLAMLVFVKNFLAKPDLTESGASSPEANTTVFKRKAYGWLATLSIVLLYVAALLSKTVTASLPVALCLILWWSREKWTPRHVRLIVTLFLIGVPLGLTTAYLEKHHVGASGAAWDYSLGERFLIAGSSLVFYLKKIVFPYPIVFVYGHWDLKALETFLAPLLFLLVLGVVASRDWTRSTLVASLFFVTTLFPALGFINVYPLQYTFAADHYQYLASLGPIVFLAGVSSAVLASKVMWRPLLMTAGVAIIAVLGLRTSIECEKYQDRESLWVDTIQKNPECQMAIVNLGLEWQAEGRIEESRVLFRKAIELQPEEPTARVNYALLEYYSGNVSLAVSQLEAVLKMDPENSLALYNLGVLLQEKGEIRQAESILLKLLEIEPENSGANNALALMAYDRGDLATALQRFGIAHQQARLVPDYSINYGAVLIDANLHAQAIPVLNWALESNPSHGMAHRFLAVAYHRTGDDSSACQHALIASQQGVSDEVLQKILAACK